MSFFASDFGYIQSFVFVVVARLAKKGNIIRKMRLNFEAFKNEMNMLRGGLAYELFNTVQFRNHNFCDVYGSRL